LPPEPSRAQYIAAATLLLAADHFPKQAADFLPPLLSGFVTVLKELTDHLHFIEKDVETFLKTAPPFSYSVPGKYQNVSCSPYQLPDAPPPPDDPPPPEKPDPPDDHDVPELPELIDKPPIEARPFVRKSF